MYKHLTAALGVAALVSAAGAQNSYRDTVLVASHAHYNPSVMVDPLLLNGWGVAIRPPGAGGHFWISNSGSGTTTTYVGDVNGAPLSQDSLRVVAIGRGKGVRHDGRPTTDTPQPTGQVYNSSSTDFMVTGEGITAASKFIFVTAEGTISGWTQVPDPSNPGHFRNQTTSVVMFDRSQEFDDDRLIYTGCAVTDYPSDNRLYVTDLTGNRVEVFDKDFKRVTLPPGRFRYPGQREDFVPWNIQYFRSGPNHEGRLWVAYCQTEEPWEQMTDTGDVCEFDLDGNFLRRLHQSVHDDPYANGELRAPWGLAIAPADFGPLSNSLLVANFGDGTIAAYDLATARFIDFVRDRDGQPIAIDGIWGLTFGNGVALGDSNALYYTAGPNGEQDGLFGSIRYNQRVCGADFNADGTVNSQDFFTFLGALFTSNPDADVNDDGKIDAADLVAYTVCFFRGR
jgi:uncharacterized protein (TIGR03118 family)